MGKRTTLCTGMCKACGFARHSPCETHLEVVWQDGAGKHGKTEKSDDHRKLIVISDGTGEVGCLVSETDGDIRHG